jgi:hypothetical protein
MGNLPTVADTAEIFHDVSLDTNDPPMDVTALKDELDEIESFVSEAWVICQWVEILLMHLRGKRIEMAISAHRTGDGGLFIPQVPSVLVRCYLRKQILMARDLQWMTVIAMTHRHQVIRRGQRHYERSIHSR